MHREVAPEEVRRHRLDVRPDEVALRVVDRERRQATAARAADVPDARRRHVEAAAACDLEAQVEVDVLEVTEEALVEAAEPDEPVAPVERGRSGRPEHLLLHQRRLDRRALAARPGGAVDVVDVAGRIELPASPARSTMLANAAISGCSSAAATRVASHSGSAVASGFSSATSSQSSSIAMPMLLAAAKPMFSSSRISVTPGNLAVIAAADSSLLALSITTTRSGASVWAAIEPTASSRRPSALKLTITTPTLEAPHRMVGRQPGQRGHTLLGRAARTASRGCVVGLLAGTRARRPRTLAPKAWSSSSPPAPSSSTSAPSGYVARELVARGAQAVDGLEHDPSMPRRRELRLAASLSDRWRLPTSSQLPTTSYRRDRLRRLRRQRRLRHMRRPAAGRRRRAPPPIPTTTRRHEARAASASMGSYSSPSTATAPSATSSRARYPLAQPTSRTTEPGK